MSTACLEEEPQQIPKLQPTLVNAVAIVLFTLFVAGVVIMIAVFHRLKIKRYVQSYDIECPTEIVVPNALIECCICVFAGRR